MTNTLREWLHRPTIAPLPNCTMCGLAATIMIDEAHIYFNRGKNDAIFTGCNTCAGCFINEILRCAAARPLEGKE